MKKLWLCCLLSMVCALLIHVAAFGQTPAEDQQGCKDYPLFNRMPNYHLTDCATVEFDRQEVSGRSAARGTEAKTGRSRRRIYVLDVWPE